MSSTNNNTTENTPVDLLEDKIVSDSSSSIVFREKNDEADDTQNVQPVVEDQSGNERKETILACLQVVGAFSLMFNSWGVANTFGAYQQYYESNLLKDQSPSNISWIGSIQACLLLFVGAATGPMFDAGYLRTMVVCGSVLVVFGMMMTSVCHSYWQVMLAQGVVVGCGMGFMMLPSVAVMPQYFKTKRAFATGLGAAGSSLGKFSLTVLEDDC